MRVATLIKLAAALAFAGAPPPAALNANRGATPP